MQIQFSEEQLKQFEDKRRQIASTMEEPMKQYIKNYLGVPVNEEGLSHIESVVRLFCALFQTDQVPTQITTATKGEEKIFFLMNEGESLDKYFPQ